MHSPTSVGQARHHRTIHIFWGQFLQLLIQQFIMAPNTVSHAIKPLCAADVNCEERSEACTTLAIHVHSMPARPQARTCTLEWPHTSVQHTE